MSEDFIRSDKFKKERKDLFIIVYNNAEELLYYDYFTKPYDDKLTHHLFCYDDIIEFLEVVDYPFIGKTIKRNKINQHNARMQAEYCVGIQTTDNFFSTLRAWVFINAEQIRHKLQFNKL